MPRPRVHLGIDYGTSTSKIVIRDFTGREGDRAIVLQENSSFRFASSVALSGDSLRLGVANSNGSRERIYHSVKMRVADEVKGGADRYCYAPTETLPDGFRAADLATLSVARLIDKG